MFVFIFSLFLATGFMSIGLYQIAADGMQLPTFASTRMALNLARKGRKKTSWYETILFTVSERISKVIHLTEYKRQRLASDLKAIGVSMTPEMWIAQAYVKSGIYLVAAVLVIPIFPLLFPILLLVGLRELFRQLQSADVQIRKKRESIEADLPRFAASVAQELKGTRNVLAILEGYLNSAGSGFREELEITVADMRSGQQETALTRLRNRVSSTMLKDVVQGLLSVLRGDDGVQYFALLSHDFKQIELQKLKLEAAKRPPKVRVYSGLLLVCFMLTYALIIVMQIMQSVTMFKM